MKISHEIPTQLFNYHDLISDYPYVLGHLLMKETKYYNQQYADFYREKLKDSSFSILDNGLFELSEPVAPQILYELGEEYKPTHLIIPDFLHDLNKTVGSSQIYLSKFENVSTCRFIAVLQGNTVDELLTCYRIYCDVPAIDIVAVPFDCLPDAIQFTRFQFLKCLFSQCEIRKRLHLLGCLKPQEMNLYAADTKFYPFINSVDTSSPVVCGWSGIKFNGEGYKETKPKDKLAEHLDIVLHKEQLNLIFHNVRMFRNYLK